MARLNAEKIEINFQSTKKLANYKNFNHALKRGAMEIVSKHKVINRMEHALVEQGWREMIKKRHAYGQKMKNDPKRGPMEEKSSSEKN